MPILTLDREVLHADHQVQQAPTRSQDGFDVSATGLLVPSLGLAVPNSARTNEILIPTLDQVIEIHKAPEAKSLQVEKLALALHNSPLFLAREFEQEMDEVPFAREVLGNLAEIYGRFHEHPNHFTAEALARRETTRTYYDKDEGETKTLTTSSPSPVELLALKVVALSREAGYRREGLSNKFLKDLIRFLQGYKMNTEFHTRLPEMPDLAMAILDSLQKDGGKESYRMLCYRVLEQIEIPASLRESILQTMSVVHGDSRHPLAFSLTIDQLESKTPNPTAENHNERRAALLQKLSGTPQELFDRFAELQAEAEGLMFAGDIHNLPEGKVGMEIEFPEILPIAKQSKDWRLGDDSSMYELRKLDSSLTFGPEYIHSLIDAGTFLTDIRAIPASLHLHFDNEVHTTQHYGHIFDYGEEAASVEGRYGTWEDRQFMAPDRLARLDTATLANLTLMSVLAHSTDTVHRTQLVAHTEVTLSQAVWGHLCATIEDPQTRLAMLLTMKHPFVVRAINPLAFLGTFTSDSLPLLEHELEDTFTEQQRKLMKLATNFGFSKKIRISDVLRSMEDRPIYNELFLFIFDNLPMYKDELQRTILRIKKQSVLHFIYNELTRIQSPERIELLTLFTSDKFDLSLRYESYEYLIGHGQGDSDRLFLQLIASPDPRLRQIATNSMYWGEKAEQEKRTRKLIEIALKSPYPDVVANVLTFLDVLNPNDRARLMAFALDLRPENTVIRETAFRELLREIPNELPIPFLLTGLRERSRLIVSACLHILMENGEHDVDLYNFFLGIPQHSTLIDNEFIRDQLAAFVVKHDHGSFDFTAFFTQAHPTELKNTILQAIASKPNPNMKLLKRMLNKETDFLMKIVIQQTYDRALQPPQQHKISIVQKIREAPITKKREDSSSPDDLQQLLLDPKRNASKLQHIAEESTKPDISMLVVNTMLQDVEYFLPYLKVIILTTPDLGSRILAQLNPDSSTHYELIKDIIHTNHKIARSSLETELTANLDRYRAVLWKIMYEENFTDYKKAMLLRILASDPRGNQSACAELFTYLNSDAKKRQVHFGLVQVLAEVLVGSPI